MIAISSTDVFTIADKQRLKCIQKKVYMELKNGIAYLKYSSQKHHHHFLPQTKSFFKAFLIEAYFLSALLIDFSWLIGDDDDSDFLTIIS
mgnify:CR=1 FL=1